MAQWTNLLGTAYLLTAQKKTGALAQVLRQAGRQTKILSSEIFDSVTSLQIASSYGAFQWVC